MFKRDIECVFVPRCVCMYELWIRVRITELESQYVLHVLSSTTRGGRWLVVGRRTVIVSVIMMVIMIVIMMVIMMVIMSVHPPSSWCTCIRLWRR